MSRLIGLAAVLAAFGLLLWTALEVAPIDGRHVLALILFAAGSSLILADRDAQEEDW